MPRRNSLTRRFLHHLLLLSLARCTVTVLGRGRAWDEWDERGETEPQPVSKRSFQRRFVHAMSFSVLFFAGLALSAGAGNGVRSMPRRQDDPGRRAGRDRFTGATGPRAQPGQAAPRHRPGRSTQASSLPGEPRRAGSGAEDRVHLAGLRTRRLSHRLRRRRQRLHDARPPPGREAHPPHVNRKHKAPKPEKAPALDPEVDAAAGATVSLNRSAPDPTPPARLRARVRRELRRVLRQAHVDWALVLATLGTGHNGACREPATLQRLLVPPERPGGRANGSAAGLVLEQHLGRRPVVALRDTTGPSGCEPGARPPPRRPTSRIASCTTRSCTSTRAGGETSPPAASSSVLAVMLYLAQAYREITVPCLVSGHRLYARPGVVSAHVYGRAVDIAAVHNVSITGHQRPAGSRSRPRQHPHAPGRMLPVAV